MIRRLIQYCIIVFLFIFSSVGILTAESENAEIVIVRVPAFSDVQSIVTDPQLEKFFLPHKKGAHIVRYDLSNPDISPQNLTGDFIAACDPSISFDSRKMLFAGKKTINDLWQIWQYDFKDQTYLQITNRETDCIQPLWVGSLFHLDDKAPSDRIVFVSRENEDLPFALYSCDIDGANVLKITHNLGHDFDPTVLANGRVVYSCERSGGDFTLLAVNNDGTDLMPYLDEHGQSVVQYNPTVSMDGRLYFLESKQFNDLPFLSFVTLRRPLKSKVKLMAEPIDVLYPSALSKDQLLLSKRNQQTNCYELVELNPNEPSQIKTLFSEQKWHCLDAQLVIERPQVRGRSTVVDVSKSTGVFYCIDVYRSNIPEVEVIEPGSIKKVKVYQGGLNQDYIKTLGTAPVEKDGSFHIEVPAQTPLTFELLNDSGEPVMKQKTWTWVMPYEKRGCIGCHEDREMVPPNRMPMAVTKPAVLLPDGSVQVHLEK